MMNVVKGMDQAMKAMDLEKVCPAPFRFPNQLICRVEADMVDRFPR
jgi:hypothetical protein